MACGLILDSVARGRSELKRLAYLATPAIAPLQAVEVAATAATAVATEIATEATAEVVQRRAEGEGEIRQTAREA